LKLVDWERKWSDSQCMINYASHAITHN
jgi:hypothetical protein